MTQMIENIIKIVLILMTLATAIAFLVGITKTVRCFSRARADKKYGEAVIKVICLILCGIAVWMWLMYFDIYRVVLTAIGVPFLHMLLFMIVGFVSSGYIKDSKLLFWITVLSYLTFLPFYAVMPGGVEMYQGRCAVFGLVTSASALEKCIVYSMRMMQANILCMICQVIIILIQKNKKTKDGIAEVLS